jgi:uncharacterized membrane protein
MHQLSVEEIALLQELRQRKPARLRKKIVLGPIPVTFGQRVSDIVAAVVGSWAFIITQSILLVLWMFVNAAAFVFRWDPYPFILLNLVLSFQAAFTAPILLMSQNRHSELDRLNLQHDFDVNIKAELEIEQLHEKLDLLRGSEIVKLIDIVEKLHARIDELQAKRGNPTTLDMVADSD